MNNSVFIIAEAGVNHNGDISLARQMIEVACEARADAIKFQSFKAEELVTTSAPKAAYQADPNSKLENQYSMLKRLELSPEHHQQLIDCCLQHKIEFLSTGFDEESIDMLNKLGQVRFKIPSGEITNLPYLRHIGGLGKPIIMSSGMATLEEIEAAIETIESAGTSRDNLIILHCTTAYPAILQDVNLRAMSTIRHAFDVKVGYSDHTLGLNVPIAAAALGATVIEKHFTLDRNLPGPDHKASLEPEELKDMVAAIRNIEIALGDGLKKPVAAELVNMSSARRSIVARKPIAKGEKFTELNIAAKRPGTGLSPMLWDQVIGQHSTREFEQDELIEL